jgi:hypothetical protein
MSEFRTRVARGCVRKVFVRELIVPASYGAAG